MWPSVQGTVKHSVHNSLIRHTTTKSNRQNTPRVQDRRKINFVLPVKGRTRSIRITSYPVQAQFSKSSSRRNQDGIDSIAVKTLPTKSLRTYSNKSVTTSFPTEDNAESGRAVQIQQITSEAWSTLASWPVQNQILEYCAMQTPKPTHKTPRSLLSVHTSCT
jgi:hypothetical protein